MSQGKSCLCVYSFWGKYIYSGMVYPNYFCSDSRTLWRYHKTKFSKLNHLHLILKGDFVRWVSNYIKVLCNHNLGWIYIFTYERQLLKNKNQSKEHQFHLCDRKLCCMVLKCENFGQTWDLKFSSFFYFLNFLFFFASFTDVTLLPGKRPHSRWGQRKSYLRWRGSRTPLASCRCRGGSVSHPPPAG